MSVQVREGPETAVHASPIAEPIRQRVLRGAVIGVVAALLLAFSGAFGTGLATIGPRILYWLAVILPGSALGLLIAGVVHPWGRLAHWPWLEIGVIGLLVALPHTFIVVVASVVTFGADLVDIGTVVRFFCAVLPVSLVMTAINFRSKPRLVPVPMPVPAPKAEPAPPAPAPAAMPPAFAERLPPRLRAGRLLALAAEDHYLRVHTDQGSDLVLMRMADAAALLADVPGARVHRSWWVARAAVIGSRRDGDRLWLQLESGLEVPVSRTSRRDLAADGWL